MTSSGLVLHKEDSPFGKRPILIVKWNRGASLDEEGDEDLNAVDQLLHGRISQVGTPDLEIATPALVAFNEFSWWFPIPRRCVVLDLVIELGRRFKARCDRYQLSLRSHHSTEELYPLAAIRATFPRCPVLWYR